MCMSIFSNIFFSIWQTSHVTGPDYENFPRQSSCVDLVLFVLGTLEDFLSNIRHGFLQSDPINHLQNDLYIFYSLFLCLRSFQLR